MEELARLPRMPETQSPSPSASPQPAAEKSRQLASLESGSKGESFKQILRKPVTVVAFVLGLAVLGIVLLLQQDPAALILAAPEARYELLRNEGRTEGVPIAIQLGPLTVFEISDPLAGGSGAVRAKQVVENLSTALADLQDSPGRVITIQPAGEDGLPSIVQKEDTDSAASLEIVRVTPDDMLLAGTDDAKLLARVWAERLTDTIRLLLFGEPPEFSRESAFGGALDTLYVNARSEVGRLTTEALSTAFDELSDELRHALTTFPALTAVDPEQPSEASAKSPTRRG